MESGNEFLWGSSQPIREKRHEIRTIKIVVVVVLLLFSDIRVAKAPIQ